jgi:hypothetical protein
LLLTTDERCRLRDRRMALLDGLLSADNALVLGDLVLGLPRPAFGSSFDTTCCSRLAPPVTITSKPFVTEGKTPTVFGDPNRLHGPSTTSVTLTASLHKLRVPALMHDTSSSLFLRHVLATQHFVQ